MRQRAWLIQSPLSDSQRRSMFHLSRAISRRVSPLISDGKDLDRLARRCRNSIIHLIKEGARRSERIEGTGCSGASVALTFCQTLDHTEVHLTQGDVWAGQSKIRSLPGYLFGIFGAPFLLSAMMEGPVLAALNSVQAGCG